MNKKIPADAVSFYFGLGPSRSYEAVAQRYGVTKRAVTEVAKRENWQEHVAELDRKARERAEEKVLETLDEMNGRHLKVLRYIQSKSIETLKAMPLDSAMDAVKAFTLSAEKERVIRGQPSDRTAIEIADLLKTETLACSMPAGTDEWADEAAQDEPEEEDGPEQDDGGAA